MTLLVKIFIKLLQKANKNAAGAAARRSQSFLFFVRRFSFDSFPRSSRTIFA